MILKNKFYKFIGIGGINTMASYIVYLLLLMLLNYQVSYAIAFIFGLVLSFWLNTQFVFQSKRTVKKFALFPMVYLVQYLAGALLLSVLVEYLQVNKAFGPLIVTIVLLPFTYLMSKKILS
jgi:putative flippase GtrA